MMQEFAIDALSEYGTDELSDTQRVVNPRWRELSSQCRSVRSRLNRTKQKFGSLHANTKLKERDYEDWQQRKSELEEDIDQLKRQLEVVKEKRSGEERHLTMEELREEDQFQQLAPTRKLMIDTIKMIAYRCETSMAEHLKPHLGKETDARRLLKDLYKSPANILPDQDNKILRIKVHHMSTPRANAAIEELLKMLNETETLYPGTDFQLQFSFAGSTDPPN